MKQHVYLLSFLLLSFVASAQTTYVVSSAADSGPNTLREAISRINSGTDAAPYTVTFSTAGPVTLTAALPAITRSCTITGFSTLTPATATGGTTIERSGSAGNFSVLSFNGTGITVYLQDLLLQGGAAGSGEGGALYVNAGGGNVTINRCLIRNSTAISGGGARVISGTLTLSDCQFANNTATNTSGSGVFGGALGINCSTFTANRCTFTGNSARFGGVLDSFATNATMANCTFTGNSATSVANCIYLNPGTAMDVIHCSFIRNLGRDMVLDLDGGSARMLNCLLLGNQNRNLFTIGQKPTTLGGNVSDNADDSRTLTDPTDKTGLRLFAGPLQQNNGGLVATCSIGDCSPAKDAGVTSSTAVTIPTTDANNKPRTGAPDAGAFEVQVPTSVSLTAGNSGTITCVNQVLTSSLSGGTSGTYVFAGPGLSTTTTSTTAIASQAGTYTVTVTSAEGCTASATTSVFADTASPGISLSVSNSGIITCSTQAVTLTAGSPTAGSSFSFTSPGGAVQTTNLLTVNTTGIYSVTATNPQNGCVSSTTATVTSSTEVPGVSLTATNGGVLVCGTQTLTLTAGSQTNGVSYSFTGTNPFTTSGNSIIVAAPGQYSVSALNPANGCFSTTSLTVSENLIPPGPVSIDKSGAIGCGPNSVTLSASATGAVSYTLLPANQSSASGQFVVTSTGSYTVIAANGTGAGCQSSGTTTVNQGVGAVAGPMSLSGQPNAANPGRLSATGTGVRFVFTGPNGYVFSAVYRSSGTYNVIANGIIAPGVYTLTVYGTEGCPPATSSITVQ
ncbi:choice-of-anchor Q domain-containing protein [Arsenicibacter rosenii]|uniref:Right handed beta helix domain-containing protein n=1 Tax=Arsenicibacter rosenii TaxID=1750698 RepID=A0A1S2VDE6_9BACT|nr:choice-of-anchor Q domain-containing protein [Arsenicibacter rosenii]OIN56781.1 hypothetical protein BLX24_22665 [Arsenicibacter rosenii]